MSIKILLSDSHDPWFNLAVEDWIFHDMQAVNQVLFLWRNAPSVVIGRSQNPWVECHLEKMRADEIKLARRQSGGGAVFHDLGNTNFTFMSRKQDYDKEVNSQIIITALANLRVSARTQGRNDLVVMANGEQRKISGSAFKIKLDRAFHHGTLLLNADLSRLNDYLNPNKRKLAAKGVKSVRSRVVNLSEINSAINHDTISEQIIEVFKRHYQADCTPELLCTASLQARPELQQRYRELKAWDWLYGQTLPFTHQLEDRFDWGTVDLRLQVAAGIIDHAQFFSDCLEPEFVDLVQGALVNVPYQHTSINAVIAALSDSYQVHALKLRDVSQLMLAEIDCSTG